MTLQKAVIFTLGTRGDIQPYIFLAGALNKAGFKTVIATHPCWKALIEGAGIDFSPIGLDIDISHEAAVIRGKSRSWLIGAIRTMKFVFKIIEGASEEIYQLCMNTDLVIASHSHAGAVEAKVCKKPVIDVTLQPEAIPQVNRPRSFWQQVSEKLIGMIVNPMMIGPYNKILKKYSLAPVKTMDGLISSYLNLIPISSYVVAENPYWEKKNQITGYWYDEEEDYTPPEELNRFLESGSQPVIVALGAMSFESKEDKDKLDILVHAFQKTGMRAVIQGFDETLKNYSLPETMIRTGAVPHSWLFRQGCCVMHHGGFGTSASAMLAGRPSIVIPHILDQFIWADKIYQLNAGMKPIKADELDEKTLVETIERLKDNYDEIENEVQQLSLKMRAEKGLNRAVALIQNACKEISGD